MNSQVVAPLFSFWGNRKASGWLNSVPFTVRKRQPPMRAGHLPAAGNRNGASVNNVGSNGNYWSSTYNNSNNAYNLNFNSGNVNPSNNNNRYNGNSVRLVRSAKNNLCPFIFFVFYEYNI